jgi:transcriptional regulator with PAS, ATPase and Fis domain
VSEGTVSSSLEASHRGRAAAATAQLFLLSQCERPAAGSARHLLDEVDTVLIGRATTRSVTVDARTRAMEIALPDPRASRRHARLARASDAWLFEDARSKNGSLVNGRRTRRAHLQDGDVIEIGHTFFLFRDAVPAAGTDRRAELAADDLHAPSPSLKTFEASLARTFSDLARIATSDIAVLLLGETGTGKEVAARAIHALSRRRGEFVAVNCAAIVPTLLEAELFGHRRGAFSGAVDDRAGIVRRAHGGTLFLDEIGELPRPAQAALLRVLQEREVVPVGDSRPVAVETRFICATNVDLGAPRADGPLRRDLHARVAGYTARLPPLRQRREDLGILVAELLRTRRGERGSPRLTPAAARCLIAHDWPLNVRELEQCLRTALALAGDEPIDARHLPEAVRAERASTLSDDDQRLRESLDSLLARHKGNVAAVARELGKGRMQVHRWARRFGLRLDGYRR